MMTKKSLTDQIAEFVVENQDSSYRLAYGYVKNVEDALDIVQESIFKAISAMDSLKNPRYIKTWFYRIIVNTSLDFMRKNKKVVLTDGESRSSLDAGTVDNDNDLDLQQALAELPDHYRVIVVLRYFEDLKIQEIAGILNENLSTVKTHLYKALEMLRIQMNDLN